MPVLPKIQIWPITDVVCNEVMDRRCPCITIQMRCHIVGMLNDAVSIEPKDEIAQCCQSVFLLGNALLELVQRGCIARRG